MNEAVYDRANSNRAIRNHEGIHGTDRVCPEGGGKGNMSYYVQLEMRFTIDNSRGNVEYYDLFNFLYAASGSLVEFEPHERIRGLPFFQSPRWDSCLKGLDGIFSENGVRSWVTPGGYLKVRIKSEFNNHTTEIESLVEWISPYIAGHKPKQYIGRYRWEGRDWINLYAKRHEQKSH